MGREAGWHGSELSGSFQQQLLPYPAESGRIRRVQRRKVTSSRGSHRGERGALCRLFDDRIAPHDCCMTTFGYGRTIGTKRENRMPRVRLSVR